jgi:hypothetical protein
MMIGADEYRNKKSTAVGIPHTGEDQDNAGYKLKRRRSCAGELLLRCYADLPLGS